MDKKEIRALVAAKKKLLTQDDRRCMDALLWAWLESEPAFLSAGTVLTYCSLPDEPCSDGFLKRWYGRKRIAVPLVKGDSLVLKEYIPGKLAPGYKGISEPSDDLPDISPSEIEYAIIPGVAFDPKGGRLGRGKGFYDRLLPQLDCFCAGIAWPCQMMDSIPADPWDRPVDKVFYMI